MARRGYSRPRFPSPHAIKINLILIFAFFVLVFIFHSRQWHLPDDEQKQQTFFHNDSQTDQMPDADLWDAPLSYGLRPCVKPTSRYKAATGWDHYMTVRSNGGLNQMRTGIADMVAVARIMNATLVIPQLDKRSFWHDSSTFSDIFDELHFIETLREDVKIVKELPLELANVPRARKHFTSWASTSYYEDMTQLWKEYQVTDVMKFNTLNKSLVLE